ncbi:flavodoxin domain-containing protein [Mesorhizobium sp.]|uniref:flavodoxin domain-containing protein n=1 Tax=Mesorhizobium sp. TaxID=1871066 RepID=UPI00257EA208|nr:flavodoxin domain-containing protein [Mesorhizobium sp.]
MERPKARKIAEWPATHIRERGHQVELRDSAALAPDLKLGALHAFIVAASVHHERHQDDITNFVLAHHQLLNTKPSAFIRVEPG